MSGLIAFVTRSFNRLLPFATPGTPLIQDLLHLAALCSVLYFAPQIQAYYQRQTIRTDTNEQTQAPEDTTHRQDIQHQPPQRHEEPHDQRPRIQPDNNHDNAPHNNEVEGLDPADHARAEAQAEAGPAQPQARPPPAREVGKKKAASLARRDQRRAYHEFQRQQGELQRARDAEGAVEREEALARERERRAEAEASLREKEAREREVRREKETRARELEVGNRERVVKLVREGLEKERMVCLKDLVARIGGVDQSWVEGIVKACGVLGQTEEGVTMLTGQGWVVRVRREDMYECYRRLVEMENGEEIDCKTIGGVLEGVVRRPEVSST